MTEKIAKYLNRIIIKNHPVLKDITLDLVNPKTNEPYEIVAFVGENGCGKTTLLNVLFNYDSSEYIVDKENIDRPHRALYLRQGSVHSNALKEVRKLIDGKDMYPVTSSRNPLFETRLWNNAKVLNIIDELGDSDVHKVVADKKLDEIYCSGDVSKLIDGKDHGYNITKFSSGQQEILLKLKDIQELSYDDFLLLDEPETSLHPRWQKQIINLIREMVDNEQGQTPQIFLATHSEKVLESLIENENALIIRLFKENDRIKYEQINQMSLYLPKTTFAELDYVIFHIPSYEYHDELLTQYANLNDIETIGDLDKSIRLHPLYDRKLYAKRWVSTIKQKETEFRTLPAYIRNYFHHPKEGKAPSEEELVKSIEFIKELIKSSNS